MVLAPFLVIYSIVGLAMLAALLLYIELSLISRAFVVLGLSPRTALSVLFISLIGSYANIPLYTVPAGPELSTESVNNFGVIYTIPREYGGAGTTVAINVGGAIVPIAVAAYALAHSPAAILPAVAATTIVALVTHRVAYLVPGIGIGLPFFIPPIAAALAAFFLTRVIGLRRITHVVAYASGVLGTLIGADLTNLYRISGLGAPIVSIGGAGTYDGVFLTGIVAVLLASV